MPIIARLRIPSIVLACLAAAGCGARAPEPAAPAVVAPLRAAASSGASRSDRPDDPFGPLPSADPDEAFARAVREGKPVLLFFTAEWCGYCRQLMAEVADHADLAAAMSDFVCVRVDVDACPRKAEEYQVRVFPTVVVATNRGVPFGRITGAQSAERFTADLRTALAGFADRRPSGETLQR